MSASDEKQIGLRSPTESALFLVAISIEAVGKRKKHVADFEPQKPKSTWMDGNFGSNYLYTPFSCLYPGNRISI